jgi:hypothetical protein
MENFDQPKRRKKPYKELIINGIYKDWKSFYEPNKEEIYKSIIEIFEEFKNTKKYCKKLYLYLFWGEQVIVLQLKEAEYKKD